MDLFDSNEGGYRVYLGAQHFRSQAALFLWGAGTFYLIQAVLKECVIDMIGILVTLLISPLWMLRK